jgi:hypothetical protein
MRKLTLLTLSLAVAVQTAVFSSSAMADKPKRISTAKSPLQAAVQAAPAKSNKSSLGGASSKLVKNLNKSTSGKSLPQAALNSNLPKVAKGLKNGDLPWKNGANAANSLAQKITDQQAAKKKVTDSLVDQLKKSDSPPKVKFPIDLVTPQNPAKPKFPLDPGLFNPADTIKPKFPLDPGIFTPKDPIKPKFPLDPGIFVPLDPPAGDPPSDTPTKTPGDDPNCPTPCPPACPPIWRLPIWYTGGLGLGVYNVCPPIYYDSVQDVNITQVVSTTVEQPAAPSLEVVPVMVPSGSTILLRGIDFGSTAGQVKLQVNQLALPAMVIRWEASQVMATLMMLDVSDPISARIVVLNADGAEILTQDIVLIAPRQVSVVSPTE